MDTRKVILYIAMSLDGFIARDNGDVDWLTMDTTPLEVDTMYEDFFEEVDTVVMGRKTYDQVVSELAPNDYPYKNKLSYVMTTQDRQNTETVFFVNESINELILNLKKQMGKNIWIVGGNTIITPLINSNLIDEYRIALLPVLLSSGISLFSSLTKEVKLKQVAAQKINELTYLTLEKL